MPEETVNCNFFKGLLVVPYWNKKNNRPYDTDFSSAVLPYLINSLFAVFPAIKNIIVHGDVAVIYHVTIVAIGHGDIDIVIYINFATK